MEDLVNSTMNVIENLNQVKGFHPNIFLRLLEENKEDHSQTTTLDVVYRILWFRAKYPNGKIAKIIHSVNNDSALIEARVYPDITSPMDCYLANGFSHKFRSKDLTFGNKFTMAAETEAVGRALATAGFGTQFVPPLKEQEGIVDSPVRWKPVPLKKESFPPPTSPESQTIADNIPQVESNEEEITQVTPDMSVTAIVKNLSVKDALNVVIDSGKNEGKTFREVVKTRPQALHWYYRDYSGKNNLIRAAAKRLLDEAQRQQQQRQSV